MFNVPLRREAHANSAESRSNWLYERRRVDESLDDLRSAGPEGGVCEDCLADVSVLTESVIQEAAAEHTSDDTVDGPLRVVTVRVTDGAGFTQAEQTLSITHVHRRHSRRLRLEDAQREAGEAADRLRVRLDQQAAARRG